MTMPDAPDPKIALRKTAYAARRAAHTTRHKTGAVRKATLRLLAELAHQRGAVVAGYMPIRTEMDVIPTMASLSSRAKVCVPVIDGADNPLLFREWRPGCAMVEGPFGAWVPTTGPWVVPDILIVPLVGFDVACNRLGYGGGFYDRTLAKLRASQYVNAIGFAYAAQELPNIPTIVTDQPLDVIVTEQGVFHPKESK